LSSSPLTHRLLPPAAVAVVALAANLVLALGAEPLATNLAWLTLGGLLPGWLLAALVLPRHERLDTIERLVFAAGLGLAVLILGGLLLAYAPGPITAARAIVAADVLLAVLLALVARRGVPLGARGPSREIWAHVALVVLIGAALRLPNLGYAEFQGDEAAVMLKAAAAVEGRPDALFVHKKGPAEIVLPAVPYALAGVTSEAVARLPFALAMIGGLLALYQLGRALFSPRVALVAAALVGLNGFFVAFGRIVQYQALVFLFSTLAVLAACRARQGLAPRPHLAVGTVLVAVGVLAHYDAVFALPAAGYLVLARWREQPQARRRDALALTAAAAAGGLALAVFYVPMATHPYFREATLPYLFDVRVGSGLGPLHNSLESSLLLATFYNATYAMAFLAVTLLAALVVAVLRSWPGPRGRALAGALAAAAVVLVAWPEAPAVGGVNLTLFVLLAALALLVAGRAPSESWKATLLWFGGGFTFYAALVASPRTHIHVVFPAWSLLVAVALAGLAGRLPGARARTVAGGGLAALCAVFALYGYQMFVQHDPEYRRGFPDVRPPGFWMLTDELPANGWFGFPYRAGWKAVGELYREGRLGGTYWSNEEELVTGWYTRGAPRCDREPRYYLIAENVQDVRPVPDDLGALGYREVAAVTVAGRPKLRVWARDGARPAAAARDLAVEDHERAFDRAAHPRFETGLPLAGHLGFVPRRLEADLGGAARLEGVAVEPAEVEPGGEVVVTLYWRATAAMVRDYSVFVHMVSDDADRRVVAQSDGAPGWCGRVAPTTTWRVGRLVVDRHVLHPDAGSPPGRYALLCGLYDYETLERLPVLSGGDEGGGDQVRLGTVRLGPGR